MKIKCNGIELQYVVEGSGPWVVMSHSLACDATMWDEQARVLGRDHRVLRFDTRGHGGSDAPEGGYTLEMLADDAKGLLDGLGIRSCHWVGLSLGGMIGQTFALKYPGIFKTLTLCDTASSYGPEAAQMWQERISTANEKGMAGWFTEPFRQSRKDTMERVSKMIRNTPVAGYAGCCHAIPKLNLTHRLKEIRCPTLVLVGEQDMATPVAAAREIHSAIGGAELVIIPSAAHLSNIEQAEAFNRALLDFLARRR